MLFASGIVVVLQRFNRRPEFWGGKVIWYMDICVTQSGNVRVMIRCG